MECVAFAESSNKPWNENQDAPDDVARGLFQLSTAEFVDCVPQSCKGGIKSPVCNTLAAVNLFISYCSDGKIIGAKDHVGPPKYFPVNPLGAFRGTWGCARREGTDFPNCIAQKGITQAQLASVQCPSRSGMDYPKSTTKCGCRHKHTFTQPKFNLPWKRKGWE